MDNYGALLSMLTEARCMNTLLGIKPQ